MPCSQVGTQGDRYRAVIALNNVGVSLLEGCCYQQAIRTLKDAVNLIKTGFRHCDGPSSACPDSHDLDFASTIQSGFGRLASPQPDASRCDPPIRLVSLSQNALYRVSRLSQGPSSVVAYPIRIDEPDFESMEHRGMDLESAMVLHNFAIAYLCLSKVASSNESSRRFREGSRRVFSLSHHILLSRQISCEDDMHFLQLACLDVVGLVNLAQLHAEANEEEDAQSLYGELLNLRSLISQMEVLGELCYGTPNAPAA